MAKLKTAPGAGDVEAFLSAVDNPQRAADCRAVMAIMEKVTGEPPRLWGPSIIGFGSYHYRYASGREGDWMLAGVSPRKQALSVYIMSGFDGHDSLLESLGRFKTGKSCLYINRLEQVDTAVLETLVSRSVAWLREKYRTNST